jgi:transposase-like protein
VVDIFPNNDFMLRLLVSVTLEQNGEWIASRRYFRQEYMS